MEEGRNEDTGTVDVFEFLNSEGENEAIKHLGIPKLNSLINLPNEQSNEILGKAENSSVDLESTNESLQTCTESKQTRSNPPSSSHQVAPSNGNLYKCAECEYTTHWSRSLVDHMRVHTNQLLRCRQCDYSTVWRSDMRNHERLHSGTTFNCSHCDFKSVKRQGLIKHMRTHTGEKPFQCSQCSYSCNQKANLKKHLLRHSTTLPFTCEYCSYGCRQQQQLESHTQRHHADRLVLVSSGPQTCDRQTRPTSIVSDSSAAPRKYSETTVNVKRSVLNPAGGLREAGCVGGTLYSCQICGCESETGKEYIQHIISCHLPTGGYTCPYICLTHCHSQQELSLHWKHHHSHLLT